MDSSAVDIAHAAGESILRGFVVIISRVAIQSIERKWILVQACRLAYLLDYLSIGLSVCLVGELWKIG